MSRRARFPVYGRLEMATKATKGTVEIARSEDLFAVRPFRRRRVYALPLSVVARMVCVSIIAQEARQKLAEKKARRRGR